ncbi:hypothetical protein GW17_00059215 [Ensete ventricosum]|nr:hypothetical protein GW17_00059215 [Ensete ventricosum]
MVRQIVVEQFEAMRHTWEKSHEGQSYRGMIESYWEHHLSEQHDSKQGLQFRHVPPSTGGTYRSVRLPVWVSYRYRQYVGTPVRIEGNDVASSPYAGRRENEATPHLLMRE